MTTTNAVRTQLRMVQRRHRLGARCPQWLREGLFDAGFITVASPGDGDQYNGLALTGRGRQRLTELEDASRR